MSSLRDKSVLILVNVIFVLVSGFAVEAMGDGLTAITDYSETQDGIPLYWERAYYTGRNINDTADFDIPFGILDPHGYTPGGGTAYPLVLYLHGAGARSNWDSSRNDSEIDQVMQRSTARAFAKAAADSSGNSDYHAFVLAPQVAQGSARWAETNWGAGPYDQTDTAGNTYGEYMHALEDLLYFILDNSNNAELSSVLGINAEDIDTNQIYVVGDSMGAYGTWDILGRQPSLFAGGIAGAGSGPRNKITELLQTPIWAFHAQDDSTIPNELPDVLPPSSCEAPNDCDGDGSLGMMALMDDTFDNTSSSALVTLDDPLSSGDDPTPADSIVYSEYPSPPYGHNVATIWVDSDSDYMAWLFGQTKTGNQSPVITSAAVVNATVTIPYEYDVNATGVPEPNYTLETAPTGMTINLTTGLIQWTPDETQLGFNPVTVRATNSEGYDEQIFDVNVGGIAPHITSTPLTAINAGDLYIYDVEATGIPNLDYSLVTAPSGMSINSTTGLIQWTPTIGQLGLNPVTVEVTNTEGTDEQSFDVDVTGIEPQITSSPVTSALKGQLYTYDVNATGAPAPTFSLGEAPAGMAINATTGLIQWVPDANGVYDVNVIASNGLVPDDTQSFTITVLEEALCPEGMVHYWKLDETSGAPYVDSYGSADASCTTCPTAAVGGGKVNTAQDFNGSDERISTASISNPTSGLTVMAWINPDDLTTYDRGIISKEDAFILEVEKDISGISFSIINGSLQEFEPHVPANTIPTGAWTHVAATFDGATSTSTIYINGSYVDSGTISHSSVGNSTQPYFIGHSFFQAERYFDGKIDEVAVFDYAMSGPDIQALYNKGVGGEEYCGSSAPMTYTVNVSSGSNGEVDPNGSIIVDSGDDLLLTATPDTNFMVNNWYLDGGIVQSGLDTYVLNDITANHTINVTFKDISGDPNCPVGMVHYWKLDETSGAPYADSYGDANATCTSCPVWAVGQVGNSQDFGDANNGLHSPDIANPSGGITVMAWVNPNTLTGGDKGILFKEGAFLLELESTLNYGIDFSVQVNGGQLAEYQPSGAGVPAGEWTHIAGTYDGSEVKIYKNGVRIPGSTTKTGTIDSPVNAYAIGYSLWNDEERYFDGKIDEAAVFDHALSEAEILDLYNSGLVGEGYCVYGAPPTYTITASSGPNGDIDPSGAVVVNEGEDLMFTAEPDSGYTVDTWYLDGGAAQSGGGTYTLSTITEDHTVNVTFEEISGEPNCPSGMIHYWKLDETAGAPYVDSYGDANASCTACPVWAVGKVDNAQDFGDANNRLITGDFGNPTTGITVMAWVNPNTLSGDRDKGIVYKEGAFLLELESDNNYSIDFSVLVNGGQLNEYESTGAEVPTGQWTHIAGTYDGTEVKVYKNGVRVPGSAVKAGTIDSPVNPYMIGYSLYFGDEDRYFDGIIDEAAVFDRALSESEIDELYDRGVAGLPYCTTEEPVTYTVTASSGPNGEVDPNGAIIVNEGDELVFTAEPNSGYMVDTWYLDAGFAQSGGDMYTLSSIDANHTVLVTFQEIPPVTYTITASSGPNGEIDPNGSIVVDEGNDLEFTATADMGYTVNKWYLDGGIVQSGLDTYTLTTIMSDHTVNVTFRTIPGEPNCPSIDGIDINSAPFGLDLVSEDLICDYNLGGCATTAAVSWFKDWHPLMSLFMPIEGGPSNALKDYSDPYNPVPMDVGGSPVWNPTAFPGSGALEFDFDSQDYIDVTETMPTDTNSYTKVAWIMLTGDANSLAKNDIISGEDHTFWVPLDEYIQGRILTAGHIAPWDTVADANQLELHTWYCVAVTYDAGSETMALYKNGQLVTPATGTSNPATSVPPPDSLSGDTSSTYIGGYPYGGSGDFSYMKISEARIYDHALSAEQVQALFESPCKIVANQTAVGEAWYCSVTPYSSTAAGEPNDSNSITILEPISDLDGDRILDADDNCPRHYNVDQNDIDLDNVGDLCDNCPDTPNHDQTDSDGDGLGDLCDNCPDYGSTDPNQLDSDGDNIGDICECEAANLDGLNPVNFDDYGRLALEWLTWGLEADTNRDGVVDEVDLKQIAEHWLEECN